MDKSVAAEHPREQREVIHGCDQRAPYVEFHHPRLKTTPLRLEQRGAFGCLLVCFWKVEAVVWVDVSWKDEILSFFFCGQTMRRKDRANCCYFRRTEAGNLWRFFVCSKWTEKPQDCWWRILSAIGNEKACNCLSWKLASSNQYFFQGSWS